MNNIRYIRESLARISFHSPTPLQGISKRLVIIKYVTGSAKMDQVGTQNLTTFCTFVVS